MATPPRAARALALATAAASVLTSAAPAGAAPPIRFSQAVAYRAANGYAHAVATGDVNRDGRTDVVVGSRGVHSRGKTTLLLGGRHGRLLRPRDVGIRGDRGLVVGDFNGDRRPDILRLSDPHENLLGGMSELALGNGRGGFVGSTAFRLPIEPFYDRVGLANPVTADFNRDGRLDFAVTEAGNDRQRVWILLGDGAGGFVAAAQHHTGAGFTDQVITGRFDRGRNPDIAVVAARDADSVPGGRGGLWVLLGNGTGQFPMSRTYRIGDGLRGVDSGDFDRDGDVDLAAINGYPIETGERVDVRVLRGNGRGQFSRLRRFGAGRSPEAIAVTDVDRDRNADLVLGGGGPRDEGEIHVLRGDGSGRFGRFMRFAISPRSCCGLGGLAIADLNRDRRPDLIGANGYAHGVSVRLNATGSG
jgi:hypothetical protein